VEDLAKFFADVIEFIVGGVLFLASLVLLVNAISSDALEELSDSLRQAPEGFSGGYTIAALALIYATGILAEGVSRLCFEWRLKQKTADHFRGPDGPVAERERQRLSVMDRSDKLAEAINVQLKRLRIERTMALSALITTIAFIAAGEWWFLAFLLLTLVAGGLVEERFNRFLKTIKASYSALDELGELEDAAAT
jgi:hypothetical protein